ncbi:MAG: XdhC family protein, partial [Usitatibacteraceae bacterium]
MSDWISFLLAAQRRGETAVVITIASTKGSVPREAGTKMVVSAGDKHGTIGGGHLEYKAIAIARDMIAADGNRAMRRFPLGATLGQCCGGVVNLLFEPVPADAAWTSVLASRVAQGKDCVIVTPISGDARDGKLIFDIAMSRCTKAIGTLGSNALDAAAGSVASELF